MAESNNSYFTDAEWKQLFFPADRQQFTETEADKQVAYDSIFGVQTSGFPQWKITDLYRSLRETGNYGIYEIWPDNTIGMKPMLEAARRHLDRVHNKKIGPDDEPIEQKMIQSDRLRHKSVYHEDGSKSYTVNNGEYLLSVEVDAADADGNAESRFALVCGKPENDSGVPWVYSAFVPVQEQSTDFKDRRTNPGYQMAVSDNYRQVLFTVVEMSEILSELFGDSFVYRSAKQNQQLLYSDFFKKIPVNSGQHLPDEVIAGEKPRAILDINTLLDSLIQNGYVPEKAGDLDTDFIDVLSSVWNHVVDLHFRSEMIGAPEFNKPGKSVDLEYVVDEHGMKITYIVRDPDTVLVLEYSPAHNFFQCAVLTGKPNDTQITGAEIFQFTNNSARQIRFKTTDPLLPHELMPETAHELYRFLMTLLPAK